MSTEEWQDTNSIGNNDLPNKLKVYDYDDYDYWFLICKSVARHQRKVLSKAFANKDFDELVTW